MGFGRFLALFGLTMAIASADVLLMEQDERPEDNEIGTDMTDIGDNYINKNVFCYYANWGSVLEGFVPESINLNLCTHIVFFWAKIFNGKIDFTQWDDISTPYHKGMYERMNDLKRKKPSLKTLLSVGGYEVKSREFPQMVSTANSRKIFIDDAIIYLRKWNFDGINIDWEYPSRGQFGMFSRLLQEMRVAFEREAQQTRRSRLMLTVAVSARVKDIYQYEVFPLVRYPDFINVLTFDLHTPKDPYTGINSPLYQTSTETGVNATLNTDWAIQTWLRRGVPASKLNMGLSFYGSSFALRYESIHGLYAPAVGDGQGDECKQAFHGLNCVGFKGMCDRVFKQNWTLNYVYEQKAYYAYKDANWVGYDGRISMWYKGRYVQTWGLAGATAFPLHLDDYDGTHCRSGRFPLLTNFIAGLNGRSLQVTEFDAL